ncbi:hypothetical protein ERJ75_000264700 [Trypanosoma vivax]|nr:hypothetical protein ERJ75_000264700 [Trypanosoma vivax]
MFGPTGFNMAWESGTFIPVDQRGNIVLRSVFTNASLKSAIALVRLSGAILSPFCLSENAVREIRETLVLEGLKMVRLERLTLGMAHAVGVRDVDLFERCLSLKAVCRSLSKLNRGLLQLGDPAGLPARAVREDKR